MSDEHQDFKWLPLSEAMDLSFDDMKGVFQEFQSKILSGNL